MEYRLVLPVIKLDINGIVVLVSDFFLSSIMFLRFIHVGCFFFCCVVFYSMNIPQFVDRSYRASWALGRTLDALSVAGGPRKVRAGEGATWYVFQSQIIPGAALEQQIEGREWKQGDQREGSCHLAGEMLAA